MFKSGQTTLNVKKGISKLLISFLLINTFLVVGLPSKAYAGTSLMPPTQAEISASITKWANQYNIPPVVLKAVAWAESYWRQFKKGDLNTPLIGFDGVGIGIMQISDYDTGVKTERLSGTDRFETAVKVSDKFVAAPTAILAPAANANLVDALAAAPLAGKNSPILLTDNNTLTEATKVQLTKLGVTKVYVVGAISQAVVDQVNALPGVTAIPLKGANRMATAAAINAKLTNPAGTFVVGYYALADALSVASFAAANNYAIVVANPDGSLPVSEDASEEASEAISYGANVYTVGGPMLVTDIEGATRLAGADRFATNKVVLDTLGYTYDKVYVANGTQAHLVDSLVASSLAAKDSAPIVLTDTANGGDAAAGIIGEKLTNKSALVALGGPTVVLGSTLAKVTADALDPDQLDYINRLKYDYDFNISEGARILNQKWRTVPKIGDGDRNTLENWYFAVWAYNGWSTKNNPNYCVSQNLVSYQDKVYSFMGKKYNSTITETYQTTPWDPSTFPSDLPPSYHSTWSTPAPHHKGDLEINPNLLLSEGGSAAERANGDYWLRFQSEHPTTPVAIYSLGYYVTGYNATEGSDQAIFADKLITAAKVVTTYATSRLNSATTSDDVQIALKWYWAVLQLPNLDPIIWQEAQDGYNQALQKTFP